MRRIEIETLAELDAVAARHRTMRGWQVQDLDLTGHDAQLRTRSGRGSLFLGCTFSPGTEQVLREGGALIFPRLLDVPFDVWRSALYTPAELYDGLSAGYSETPDSSIYQWTRTQPKPPALHDTLAMALHDNCIDDALDELVAGRRVVGVMGGHALTRPDPDYRDAAHLARSLARAGLTVATGGGPGAMEAANLGALLAEADPGDLDRAVTTAAAVSTFTPSVTDWARAGLAAVEGLPHSDRSLGVPTWFYGHEPPNPFAGSIAKYFRNAIREDVLLRLSSAGIVFLPGAGGTVQEIFQSACENYYADDAHVAPMVLVGREYWTRQVPAWPLLETLGRDRPFGPQCHLVDRAEEALAALGQEG